VERTSGTDDSPMDIDQGHDEGVLLWVGFEGCFV